MTLNQQQYQNQSPLKNIWVMILSALTLLGIMFFCTTNVHASQSHSFGQDQGRTTPLTANDFHTDQWERFHFSYYFHSGTDHRDSLGRPTSFNGFVPTDIHSVNMRRDANVSLRPPRYGISSGHIPTAPSSRWFPQPVNPHFHQGVQLHDPNIQPRFDTLSQGVNHTPTLVGNPMNVQNVGSGEFLPPTSIQ